MRIQIDKQANIANAVQISHSAGAWASAIATPGDAAAWSNDDNESSGEKGALEIDMLWLGSGQMNPSPGNELRGGVISEAAVLGYYMRKKSVGELKPK
jgi:hypothetical protein